MIDVSAAAPAGIAASSFVLTAGTISIGASQVIRRQNVNTIRLTGFALLSGSASSELAPTSIR